MALFLFFGDDTYSHRKKLSFWKAEFEKKHGDMNMETLDGKEVKAKDVVSSCAAAPFLGDKRLLIVKDFLRDGSSDEREIMGKALEQIPDFCVLVFSEMGSVDKRTSLYKKLVKAAEVVDFTPPQGMQLDKWIRSEVAGRGGQIEPDAVQLLGDILGGDLYALENEIAKLCAYCGASAEAAARPINRQDIELMIDTTLATSIFKFTDALSTKNIKAATSALHNLLYTGEDPYRILYMIMRQFRIITSVKDLAEQGAHKGEIASKIKEHPFVVQNTLSIVRNFSMAQLKRAYELLIELDTQLKSGELKVLVGDKRDFALALDRLVLNLCV
ncbi:DNA polymerase III subunit delta [Candidatus Peregrinibacteria bacterium CG11_big_fil_rev_8_21_14_0_20_46_8]|nr:MAG: DNA polymerase III subunit delta [Candidatus Peregrinibacteria bacterium CG11_big_fil_rev_8_21_14_0_20_46_8]